MQSSDNMETGVSKESSIPNVDGSSTEGVAPNPPEPVRGSAQSLEILFKDWVRHYGDRNKLYGERIDAAWYGLLEDIERWESAYGSVVPDEAKKRLEIHHIHQFHVFIESAFAALMKSLQNAPQTSDDNAKVEALDFRALVVGVFTAHWLLLREVATQRVQGSPYSTNIAMLDEKLRSNYFRLRKVFGDHLDTDKLDVRYRNAPLAAFAPLVHLGNVTQLTVFDRRVPLMISVPIGALDDTKNNEVKDYSQMSLAHEVAHAIFAQAPEVLNEVRRKLRAQVQEPGPTDRPLSPRDQLLYGLAIEWTEEICADLLGTALQGEQFMKSALWSMAGSETKAGVTDETHPPALLRPMIHLMALIAMEQAGSEQFKQTEEFFRAQVAGSDQSVQVETDRLNRRFRSVPALMFVRLETMCSILNDLVKRMLVLPLETLRGKTLQQLLIEIHRTSADGLVVVEFEPWGERDDIDSNNFVLDFPGEFVPSYTVPGLDTHPDCCDVFLLRPFCGC